MITLEKMKSLPKNNYVQWLVIHNTGGTNLNPLADTSNHTFKMVQAYHISKGWENIGYHWFIEKDGNMIAGRPEHRNGAHVKEQNINTKSLGICMAGNFDAFMPTQAQIDALTGLLKAKMASYSVPIEKVVPHRHFLGKPPYKQCFGKNLSDNWLKSLLTFETPTCQPEKEKIKLLEGLITSLKKLLGMV